MSIFSSQLRVLCGVGLTVTAAANARALAAQTTTSTVDARVRAALQAKAGDKYPLGDVVIFATDSAVIEFADPTYTGEATRAGTWMFGPPVPVAEQDSCPPPKILGRKIARVLWQNGGKDRHLGTVIVMVHGTAGIDRFSNTRFYYEPSQLDGPWAGDPASLTAAPPRKGR